MKKNKYLLPFMAILLFFSCSDQDEALIQSESIIENQPKFAGDGKYDLLGFGYDVTGEHLNSSSTRFQVVDVDAFILANKSSYHEDGSKETETKIYSGATAEDFLEEIKTKNKIGTDGSFNIKAVNLGGNLSVSADISKKYTYSSKYSFARIDIVKRVKSLALNTVVEDLTPYLNPNFVKDLDRKTPEQIVANYGTHVLCDISIGARLQFDYRSAITEEQNRTEKKIIVEAGANFNVGLIKAGGTANHELEIIKERNKKNTTWNLTLKSRGNSHSGIAELYFTNANPPKDLNFQFAEWEKTAEEKGAALVDINWNRTYPIYEFVSDPIKKQLIKDVVIKYIAGMQISPLKLNPMYEMMDPRVNDRFYVYSWEDVMHQQTREKNEYLGLRGYVLAETAPNTKPMYQMWDKRGMKDRFYVYSWNEVLEQQSKWKNEYLGIAGYLLVTREENAIPIYGMLAPTWKDRYFAFSWDFVLSQLKNYNDEYYGLDGYIYPAN